MDEKDEFRRFTSKYKAEKIKSRNLSEKKRRDQFNMLINELCTMVTSSNRKMDKSSVLRSTISFLKNHSELSVQSQTVKLPENWKPSFLTNEEFTHLMLEALDGFIIVFSSNGQILYTSESTACLLGYLPSRIYSSIYDIIHEMDKSALYQLISNPPSSISKDTFMSISLHMKRGPVHPQENSTYELVNLLGSFHHWPASCEAPNQQPGSFDCDSNSCSSACSLPSPTTESRLCFVAIGRLQTPHLLRGASLPEDIKNEFTSRHSLEWKFLFLDHRAPPIIGYLPFEVLGTSGYDYYHVDDLDNIASSHELLMSTGEGTSCFYRFLTKGQQWIWLQTRYYISYHQWNSKPEFIVCTHTVVSTEKVIKCLQNVPKTIPKKPCKAPLVNSSPASACLSPSLSVSSRGSLSSETPDQCTVSPNPCAGSVLYTSPPSFSGAQYRNILPAPSSNTAEPHISTLQSQQKHSPLSSPSSTVRSSPYQDLQIRTSPSSAPPILSPLMRSPPNLPMQQFQADQNSTTPLNSPPVNPVALRNRQQFLTQQILAHKEELRHVSAQLMQFELTNPNANPSNIAGHSYMAPVMDSGVNYMNGPYQTTINHQVLAPSENIPMGSVAEFTRPTSTLSLSEARSFMDFEQADICGMTSNQMTHLSHHSAEVTDQNYTMNHQGPPNS